MFSTIFLYMMRVISLYRCLVYSGYIHVLSVDSNALTMSNQHELLHAYLYK